MKDHGYDDPEAIRRQLQQAEQDAEGFCEEIWKQKQRITSLEAEVKRLVVCWKESDTALATALARLTH